jgi:hypothetical protein
MSDKITSEDRLESVYNKIEADAIAVAGYDKIKEDALSPYQPQKATADMKKRYYKKGATPYGEKWAAAEDLMEKMAAVMKEVSESYQFMKPNLPWWVKECKKMVDDYNNYLKQGKDGE